MVPQKRDSIPPKRTVRKIEVLVKAEHDFYREKWQKRIERKSAKCVWVLTKKYGRVSKVLLKRNKIRYYKVALHIISYYTIKFDIILIAYYIDANNRHVMCQKRGSEERSKNSESFGT